MLINEICKIQNNPTQNTIFGTKFTSTVIWYQRNINYPNMSHCTYQTITMWLTRTQCETHETKFLFLYKQPILRYILIPDVPVFFSFNIMTNLECCRRQDLIQAFHLIVMKNMRQLIGVYTGSNLRLRKPQELEIGDSSATICLVMMKVE